MQLEIPIATAVAAARVARDAARSSSSTPPRSARTPRPARAGRGHRRRRGQRDRGARMALAGTASGDHPRSAGASYLGRGERFDVPAPAVEAVDTTGAGDVFAGVLAAGWPAGREHALRRACAAGALSTLVPGAGRLRAVRRGHRGRGCRRQDEDRSVTVARETPPTPPTARRRLAGHAIPEVHPRGPVRGVHAGPPRGTQRDDARDVLRHQVRGRPRRRRPRSRGPADHRHRRRVRAGRRHGRRRRATTG